MGHSAFETDALLWWLPTLIYYSTRNNSADFLCVKSRVVCLDVGRFFFLRGHKTNLKPSIFLFVFSFCDILGVKISCFHLWVCPLSSPPFFFTSCVPVCVFSLVLICMQVLELHNSIFIFFSPLSCRCLWSLFIICCSWFTQIPKSTETALHQAKLIAPDI